jgi:hypothetical protein
MTQIETQTPTMASFRRIPMHAIRAVAERIAERLHLEKIILFGFSPSSSGQGAHCLCPRVKHTNLW